MKNNYLDLELEEQIEVSSEEHFGFKTIFNISKFRNLSEFVPKHNPNYFFDEPVTESILAAFKFNKRLFLTGFHGTGKSSHIEQVASRLNWPVVRINLDGHITRSDLLGRDKIKLKGGKQITEFSEGLLSFAIQNPVALILDEYDAARPDVMFVLQKLLETDGSLTLLEENKIIKPHKYFRIFATSNTLGSGDEYGIYHGTSFINQGQLDRFNKIVYLDYLEADQEFKLLNNYFGSQKLIDDSLIKNSIKLANFIRNGFKNEEVSQTMSIRTLINFLDNFLIYNSEARAFKISFYNRVPLDEQEVVKEIFARCFDQKL